MNKSIPEMSIDTKLILHRLQKAEIGDVITYKELSEIIGRDIQAEARGCLLSAMRSCLAIERVFGTVRKVGIKRLTDRELAGIGEGIRSHISRVARKAMKKMTLVSSFDSLSNEEKIRHNTSVSMLGAIGHITSSKAIRALENKVATTLEALPLQKTLAAFMSESK